MSRRALLLVLMALLVTGCATLGSVFGSSDDDRFGAGLRALAEGDYTTAHRELSWVAEQRAGEPDGQRALLVLAALEMDPWNPARRTEIGTDLAAGFLRVPARDAWAGPIAQTMYLMGLELGAAEERVQRAERAAEQRELPRLPGMTVNARIRAVEQERERLAARVTALEEQLAAKDRELERIRKTIKP